MIETYSVIISNEIYSKDIEAIGPEVINFKEIINILTNIVYYKIDFILIFKIDYFII